MSDRYPEQASNYSIQPRYPYPQAPLMGALAAADSYAPSDWPAGPAELPDIGSPLVPSGPQVSSGQPWANKLVDTLTTPRQDAGDDTVLYKTASPRVNFTQGDINRGMDLALSFSGGGLGIKAYHGSPHDFDKFDLSKIGTGEGAQAYGHGLYFADQEATAKMYRDNLARPQFTHTGSDVPISSDLGRILEDSYNDAMNLHGVRSPSGNDAVHLAQQKLESQRADALKANDFDWYNKIADQQTELARMGKDAPKASGKMYEVDINADPAHFLDWEGKLGEQPQAVKDAFAKQLNQFGPDAKMQAQLMIAGSRHPQGLQGVTRDLAEAGVPGIKYLDQGSRGAGQGSSNYVVFNDKLIDILRKYGLAGAAPAGMGALAAQDNYPPQ